MNWYLLAVGHLAPLSNQTYSLSVDSLVSLHRLMGTLCFGPLLLRDVVLRGDQMDTS